MSKDCPDIQTFCHDNVRGIRASVSDVSLWFEALSNECPNQQFDCRSSVLSMGTILDVPVKIAVDFGKGFNRNIE